MAVSSLEEKDDSILPEHQPVIPPDPQREREKEEIRKKTKKLKEQSGKIEATITTQSGEVKKASKLNRLEQEIEIIRCASNPIYYIETYLRIFDQTQGAAGMIVPFILFEYQRKLINEYLENRFVVVNKYRQGGISTVSCAYVSWYIMFNQNRSVAIIADKLETARDELMNDVVDFIDGCPDFLKPKTGKDSEKNLKDTQKLKRYDNGSTIGAFSSKGLRGYTPTLLVWDETAWTEKGDKFWTSAMPTLQTGGSAIMVSCVTDDTYIFTNKGIKQIKDFKESETLGAKFINEYNILGRSKLRKGNLFFNNGFVDTLKIQTAYSELESSLNHKYWGYKIKTAKYGIYHANELEIDDYISIQYGMNIWGDNDDCSDFKPTESQFIKYKFNPTKITTDISYLIGLYISEGNINIYDGKCGNIRTAQLVLSCGDSLLPILNKLNLTSYCPDELHYTISSKNLIEFFQYLGFDVKRKAKRKIIPPRLFEMSKENVKALIQGIMDGDGYASYGENSNTLSIGISLTSKELINQLRILFNNFGVLTSFSERDTQPTKKVKAVSHTHSLTACGKFAESYFKEIGFRFERKQNVFNKYGSKVKDNGKNDTIPNGGLILNKIYDKIKGVGILKELYENDIKIKPYVTENRYRNKPTSRNILLKLFNFAKIDFSKEEEYKNIVSPNILWTKIKSIEKTKNNTYDFSLPNDNPEENDFHHSVIYSQVLGFQTPNGLDSVFYKTFEGARKKENNFIAVELWWFNDPRYNKELCWLKNKGKENEIRLVDENWTNEYRIKLMDDGWEASSPWFEEQVRDANGDMRKIAQEILCVRFDSLISVVDTLTDIVEDFEIHELYDILKEQNGSQFGIALNNRYLISNSEDHFGEFHGIMKSTKDIALKVTLENNTSIIVSYDHIFLANGKNMYARDLIPYVAYISTIDGDFFVKEIAFVEGCDFYDIIDSENCEYYANGILNHNCSFLGSGDNFIAEEYLKRIQENEVKPPLRQEYTDRNMWIFEDPQPLEDYIISVDASPGHGEDYSTINILKKNEIVEEKIVTKNGKTKKIKVRRHKVEQVAEYYGKTTPQTLAEIVYQYGRIYNNGYVVIDITGGYGVQTVEKLLEIGYENIHYAEVTHRPSRERLQGYIKKGQKAMVDGTIINVDLIPGFFIGSGNRGSVLLELQRAIHLEDVVIRSSRLLSELKTFITVAGNRVADHKRSFHDDSIMGLSIGLYTLNFDMARYKQSKGITEKMMNAIITVNDIGEMKARMELEDAQKGIIKPVAKPMISPNSNSPLNPYIVNAWLFNGLKDKNR